jgi:NAD(P)-dependent dehydrogenase (short-subunit alcohol dehydrogenase family)
LGKKTAADRHTAPLAIVRRKMRDAMSKHSGKTAVISGGASGIGQASAIQLAKEGAEIIIADLDKAETTLKLIAEFGGKATAFRCDVTDPASVKAFSSEVQKAGMSCDILLNNAGIYPMQNFEEMTFEDWRHVLTVNLDSMFLMTKAFIDGMKQRGWGRIINIASDTVNLVLPGFAHYVASKAGVIGLTRSIATEYGQSGITANAIAPGLTKTPGTEAREQIAGGMTKEEFFTSYANMQAIKRVQQVSDLVGVVSFLASEEARFVTAQTIYVDGGLVRV